MRTLLLCLFTLALLFPAVPPAASGDGGMFWDVNDFDVTEPGQNAIIAWNGTHETLILSVDVQTGGGDTKAVHVVPFPSLPTYSLSSAAEFSAIDDHFRTHRWYRHDIPSFWQLVEHDILAGAGGNGTDGADDGYNSGIDILSRERVGPHDIAVTEVRSSRQFKGWVEDYLKENGLGDIDLPKNTSQVVDHYLLKGCRYFIFDIIDVVEEVRAVDPLAYTFESDSLYFPLRISSLIGGETTVDLALISPADRLMDRSQLYTNGFSGYDQNPWTHGELDLYNSTMAGMFGGDVILEHHRDYIHNLSLVDYDIELGFVDTNWVASEDDHIIMNYYGDHDGDGRGDVLYFFYKSIVLRDIISGEELWRVNTAHPVLYWELDLQDINGDGIDEILVHHMSGFSAIDPTTGEITFKKSMNMMREYMLEDDGTLTVFEQHAVTRYDITTGSTIWQYVCNDTVGELDFTDYSISVLTQYENVSERYYQLYRHDELLEAVQRCYTYYYEPYIFNGSESLYDLDSDGSKELLMVYRNETCLLDIDTGELVWKTVHFNRTDWFTNIDKVEVVADQDGDDVLEVAVRMNYDDFYDDILLSGATGYPIPNATIPPRWYDSGPIDIKDPYPGYWNEYHYDVDGDGVQDDILLIYTSYDDRIEFECKINVDGEWWWTSDGNITMPREYASGNLNAVWVDERTLIMRFGHTYYGIDMDLRENTWTLDVGQYIDGYTLIDIDDDPAEEIVFTTDLGIYAMDLPLVPVPSDVIGDVAATMGPFHYNDGKTPIQGAQVLLGGDESLLLSAGWTDKAGGVSFSTAPGTYRCTLVVGDTTLINSFEVTIGDNGNVLYQTHDGTVPLSGMSPDWDDPPWLGSSGDGKEGDETSFVLEVAFAILVVVGLVILFVLLRRDRIEEY